jgi:hypothetical protein
VSRFATIIGSFPTADRGIVTNFAAALLLRPGIDRDS